MIASFARIRSDTFVAERTVASRRLVCNYIQVLSVATPPCRAILLDGRCPRRWIKCRTCLFYQCSGAGLHRVIPELRSKMTKTGYSSSLKVISRHRLPSGAVIGQKFTRIRDKVFSATVMKESASDSLKPWTVTRYWLTYTVSCVSTG